MYRHHFNCRACGSKNIEQVMDFGLMPLANNFVPLNGEHTGFAPLSVLFCEPCRLAQLSVVVNPKVLYSEYRYVTSDSPVMAKHFDTLFNDLNLKAGQRVLEIGSNDGKFLTYLKNKGVQVTGIDPAKNLNEDYFVGLFNSTNAQKILNSWGNADVVLARHVFAHIDDWRDFVIGLEAVTYADSVVAIEVPYVIDTLQQNEFDQCYHEHLSYVSVTSIFRLLEGTPFYVENVRRYNIHGGTICIIIRRRGVGSPDPNVEALMQLEKSVTISKWSFFETEMKIAVQKLRIQVGLLTDKNLRVCGFGASAKSTGWVNWCHFTKNNIEFICDRTIGKQGTVSPGTNIPIVAEEALLRLQPDYCILFAWNFLDDILKENQKYIERGGKFIVPVPFLKIIP